MLLRWLLLIMFLTLGTGDLLAQKNGQDIDERKFRGGSADGFFGSSVSLGDRLYLQGCSGRYIADGESVTLRVESNATRIQWFDQSQAVIGSGKNITVVPALPAIYKVVATLDTLVDSCYVSVNVRKDFYSGEGDGAVFMSTATPYLIAGNDQYIALGEMATLRVECHTNEILWYDDSGNEIGKGMILSQAPEITTVYKAVVHDGSYQDSCRIIVHVNDNYTGAKSDGFSRSMELPYLHGCADQYIALGEKTVLYVTSSTGLVKWYSNTRDSIGFGFDVEVHPPVTSVYYAIANDGKFRDTARIVVHVNDNYAGNYCDGFSKSVDPPYLTGGPDQYIALHEEAELTVWSHTNVVRWYDVEGNYIDEGKKIGVHPLVKSCYKAVVRDQEFVDSCFVWVHVKDHFSGNKADGFAFLRQEPFYLRGCGDRYIAHDESAELNADSYTNAVKWYEKDSVSANGWTQIGLGKRVIVKPDTTWVYKAVAQSGRFIDSCRVTVHVNDNFDGDFADGFSKNCDRPWILGYEGVKGHPCVGSEGIRLKTVSFGASNTYFWQKYDFVTKKFVALPDSLRVDVMETDRTSELRFRNLRQEFNGTYRCIVYNACDSIVGDTLPLHVNRCDIDLEVSEDTVYLCRGESREIGLKLLNGRAPWRYSWQPPSGGERQGYEDIADTATIIVKEEGVYQFLSLEDASGDVRIGAENLPRVTVIYRSQPVVKISRVNDPVCWGSEAEIELSVGGGIGPWKVWLDSGDTTADEIVCLTARDTLLRFMMTENRIYTVSKVEDYYGGKAACSGSGEGIISVAVAMPEQVMLRSLPDNYVGQCRDIDLFSKLEPVLDSRALTPADGSFYIDSVELVGSLWHSEQLKAGKHRVYFKLGDSFCGGGSVSLTLQVDSLPSAEMQLPDNICENSSGELNVKTSGNHVVFSLNRKRIDRAFSSSEISSRISVSEISGNTYKESVKFLSEDSCLIYTVSEVTDRHNCADYVTFRDTVYNRLLPWVKLESRYPDLTEKKWKQLPDTVWTLSDSVRLRIASAKWIEPVCLTYKKGGGIANRVSWGEFKLKDEGVYCFRLEDKYCVTDTAGQFMLKHANALYLRLKVLFENHIGPNKNIVVELSQNGNVMGEASFQATIDGTVLNAEGDVLLSTRDFRFTTPLLPGDYTVIIRSDGYLPVMSKRTYKLDHDRENTVLIDFTDEANVFTKDDILSHHMTRIGERDGKAVWVLSVDEENSNSLISVRDMNELLKYKNRERKKQKNRDKFSEVK